MAVTIAAGNEEHACGGDPRKEKGIVVGAAHHFEKLESMLMAGIGEGRTHFGSAISGRICIEQFRLNRDLTLRGNILLCALDRLHYAIATRLIGVADVESHAHAARDAVHRSRKYFADADGGDGVGRAARARSVFDL